MYKEMKIASRCLSASAAIAVVATLSVASPAFAADVPATAAPAPAPAPARSATRDEEPQTGTHIRTSVNPADLNRVVVFGGADLRAGDSQWTDGDASAQVLPMTRDQDTVSH